MDIPRLLTVTAGVTGPTDSHLTWGRTDRSTPPPEQGSNTQFLFSDRPAAVPDRARLRALVTCIFSSERTTAPLGPQTVVMGLVPTASTEASECISLLEELHRRLWNAQLLEHWALNPKTT